MQGWHYGKGLIYYGPIFWLTKVAFLRARTIPRENIFYRVLTIKRHPVTKMPDDWLVQNGPVLLNKLLLQLRFHRFQ